MFKELIAFPKLPNGELDMSRFFELSTKEQKLATIWLTIHGKPEENKQFRLLKSSYKKNNKKLVNQDNKDEKLSSLKKRLLNEPRLFWCELDVIIFIFLLVVYSIIDKIRNNRKKKSP